MDLKLHVKCCGICFQFLCANCAQIPLCLPNSPSANQYEVFEAAALVFTLSSAGPGPAIKLNKEGAKIPLCGQEIALTQQASQN